MRNFLIIFTFFLFSFLGEAYAAPSCYTMDEAEAEQGIRIHSELMVIGLNCQHLSKIYGSANLYAEYREFTAEHSSLFAGYEVQLMKYFKRTGDKNPEATLNTLRTAFANKVSNDAARMRPDMFCKRYAQRISKVADMDKTDLRQWATTFFPSHPLSQPLCSH